MDEIQSKKIESIAFKAELQALAGENVPEAIITIREDRLIYYANPHARLMFGYTEDEFFKKSINDLLEADDELRVNHNTHIDKWFSDPMPKPMAMRSTLSGITKTGKKIRITIYLVPASSSEGTVGMAYIRRAKED